MLQWLNDLISPNPVVTIENLEKENLSIEERVERLSVNMGKYKQKNSNELERIIKDIDAILDFIDTTLEKLGAIEATDRIRALAKKLKQNRTRAENEAKKAA